MNDATSGSLPVSEMVKQLLLGRLLVAPKKPVGAKKVEDDLGRFFQHAVSNAQWHELFTAAKNQCLEQGLIFAKPLVLTEAGRQTCCEFWRIDKLPARPSWSSLLRTRIVPRLLGVEPETVPGKNAAKALTLIVLRQRHKLPESVKTQRDLLNALAWRRLGIESTAAFTPAAVLGRCVLQTERPIQPDQVVANLAKAELVPSERDPFRAVVQKWIADAIARPSPAVLSPPLEPHGPLSLPEFAARVCDAARHSETGRFGDNKVFISHVWRRLHERPEFATTSVAQFKERLVAAHREQLVSLSRADLVERMDPADVVESETEYLDARFHFVRV